MTLLPNPGKPGFYGVDLHGRVISCQPCENVRTQNIAINLLILEFSLLSVRFPSLVDFVKCHEEISGALQEFVIPGANESMLNLML